MQELEIIHALKKENEIIIFSQIQILTLGFLKIQSFRATRVKMDFFFFTHMTNLNQILSYHSSFSSLKIDILRICSKCSRYVAIRYWSGDLQKGN